MNEDARLMHWLSSHRDETASAADPAAHVDLDTLTRHATGRLSPAQAHAVTEHLLVCDDARCVSFVRAQASDVDAASDFLYPPTDDRSSSPRTFQCREALWTMIEEVATITGAPVDDVINDAMLQYARSRGYHEGPTARRMGDEAPLDVTQDAAAFVRRHSDSLRATGAQAPSITTTAVRPGEEELSESEPSARSRAAAHPSITAQRSPALTPEAVPRAPPSVRNPAARPMTMPASMPSMPASMPPLPPAPPARGAGLAPPPARRMPAPPGGMAGPPPLAPPPPSAARSFAPPSSRRAPPPLPSTPQMPIAPQSMPLGSMGSMSLSKRLVLTFEGQSYDVDKEHFIIGRSKGQADLRIDDANVSRQHAAIERIGSIYYLVDLGSTNGVYVGDDRVTRRALADGDTIVITNHRISCRLG